MAKILKDLKFKKAYYEEMAYEASLNNDEQAQKKYESLAQKIDEEIGNMLASR